MSYVDIIYEKEDGVAWITVNRPQVYNSIRARTNQEMDNALLDAAHDPSIRVVVISGAGPNAFGAGQDQSFNNPDPKDEVGHTVSDSSLGGFFGSDRRSGLIRKIPQPVIAMVDGFAIGASHIMAYNCDITIASERSTFGQAGTRVGSPAAGHGVAYLASIVGQKRAREIWYMSMQYTAQEAFQMGLVNKVVHHDQLVDEVKKWCDQIKRMSPIIIQMEKIGFNEYGDLINPETSPWERYWGKPSEEYSKSEESLERRRAFVERRPMDPSKNLPYADVSLGD